MFYVYHLILIYNNICVTYYYSDVFFQEHRIEIFQFVIIMIILTKVEINKKYILYEFIYIYIATVHDIFLCNYFYS